MNLNARHCERCQKEYKPVRVWQKFCSELCAFKSNIGRIRLSRKKYEIKNPEKVKESKRKYFEKNKEKILEEQRNKRWSGKRKVFKRNRFCSDEELKEKAEHHRQSRKRWYRENKGHCYRRSRDNELKRSFGITLEEYEKMDQIQSGKCQICGVHYSVSGRRLAVDHCHYSKKIRGLLCRRCNQGLGLFNEDIEIFKMVIIYLNKYAYFTEPSGHSRQTPTSSTPV